MKRLIILRHGETEWSKSGQHTGTTDIPLTPEGQRQARLLGQRLLHMGIEPERVLCSPRSRALDTAQYAGLGAKVEITDLLREVDYGSYEGLTTLQIRETNPSWDLFSQGCPGGEALDQAGDRADQLFAQLEPDEGSGDIALVGHGHFSRVIGARYLGLPAAMARGLGLSTATISILGHEHEWRAITLWNYQPTR